jgi:hypothetical protein
MIARNAAIGLFAVLALAGGAWVAASQIGGHQSSQNSSPCHPEPECGAESTGCVVEPDRNKKE